MYRVIQLDNTIELDNVVACSNVTAPDSVSQRESYIGKFRDKRLDKRADQISSMLYFNQSSSIHGSTHREAEQKGAYRFFANKDVKEEILIDITKERGR